MVAVGTAVLLALILLGCAGINGWSNYSMFSKYADSFSKRYETETTESLLKE
jgi:hypothetical protein